MNKSVFRVTLGMAVLLMGTSTSIGEQVPVPLPADSRIKQFVYNENTVYRLAMHTNFISTVQFAKNEKVFPVSANGTN